MSDPYSQQPAGQQQPPYGQPYGAATQEHPQGTMILVLGIVGFFVGICGPIAWYMGRKVQKEIAATGVHYSNEQNINIGKILGMIVTILAIIGLVFGIIFAVIAIIAASSASTYGG
ncbi:hypothetical protein GCM10009841_11130 [Microlunatus panaciterrae]|uniref:Tic20 family protein n=1 Tax=Microlunatus panaciterrae TaxID=400768 RepID=A0ABS2RKY3_9ACTN|nr:hypothetical protein [Microlunatus panaciterrae]MBM7799670.1 putative Tic20 family protein [Microlunatus panaciterrae]